MHDWEQRELKNLVIRVKSYSLSRSVETNSDTNTKYIHYGDIHTHVADKIEKGTKLPNIVPGVYETLNKGDLVLADASEDYQGIATPAIVMTQTDYSLVAGLHTIALRPTKINSLYLYYLIKSPTFRKYGYKVGTGMKVFGISVNRLLEFKTLMPVTVEQSKIAELLLLMDNTITLHQRKLEQLEKLKQALLEQMFPQKDEVVPKLRFTNFQDDWEQRKLKDVANYRNGKAHEQVEDISGLFTIINSKFVSTDGKVKRHTNKQVEPMFEGELAIVLSDLPNGKALAKVFLVKEDDKYTLNQRIAGITPNGNINSEFLKYRVNRHKYFLKFDSGVSQTNLSKPEVENFVTLYPCFKEQNLIGTFLDRIDSTLTLHHHKLEQLKLIKQTLLQEMFI